MRKLVYLAGPINQCNDSEASDWRHGVRAQLEPLGFLIMDPMVRDYRGTEDENAKAIVGDDKADIAQADIVVANCWKPSVGTAMEIHHAWILGKLIVAVVPPAQPVSPWLSVHARKVFRYLEEAVAYLTAIN